jgi:hypothetical protein
MLSIVAYVDTMAVVAKPKYEMNHASASNPRAPGALYHACYAFLSMQMQNVRIRKSYSGEAVFRGTLRTTPRSLHSQAGVTSMRNPFKV